jgi:hypothetical protein
MSAVGGVDPAVFQAIQDKIDQDSVFHDVSLTIKANYGSCCQELKDIVQDLNRQSACG